MLEVLSGLLIMQLVVISTIFLFIDIPLELFFISLILGGIGLLSIPLLRMKGRRSSRPVSKE